MKIVFAAAARPHPRLRVLGACREGPPDPVNGQTRQGQRCQSSDFLSSPQTDQLSLAVGAGTGLGLVASLGRDKLILILLPLSFQRPEHPGLLVLPHQHPISFNPGSHNTKDVPEMLWMLFRAAPLLYTSWSPFLTLPPASSITSALTSQLTLISHN